MPFDSPLELSDDAFALWLSRFSDPTLRTKHGINAAGRFVSTLREVQFVPRSSNVAVATGEGSNGGYMVPSTMAGHDLVWVEMAHRTAGTGGSLTTVQLRRYRNGTSVDMLSTPVTIDLSETSSTSAAAPAVIDAANDDLQAGDIILANVTAVPTTQPTGLFVTLFTKDPTNG